MFTYADGVRAMRCEFCFSLLRGADDQPMASVRVEDVETLLWHFNEYLQADRDDETWGAMLVRFEQAIGQSFEQLKERARCERLSKEVSTS